VPRIDNFTAADVDKYHKLYVAALVELYNTHRRAYYHPTDFKGRPIEPEPLKFVR
jgi:hypothetical protein